LHTVRDFLKFAVSELTSLSVNRKPQVGLSSMQIKDSDHDPSEDYPTSSTDELKQLLYTAKATYILYEIHTSVPDKHCPGTT